MSRRGLLAGLLRPFSAVREPQEVREGRLPEQARVERVAELSPLDGRGAAPQQWLARPSSVVHATSSTWAPWCEECQLPPVGGPWSLAGAEYLARQHDIVWHSGVWRARALPAAEVAGLVAALPGGGGVR